MSDNMQPLAGDNATTRNPPNVTSKTHIVAVCGTSDIRDGASPTRDGWFVSDMYLWKHLLKGMGASQVWLTCLDPEKLVDKYEKYFPNGPYVQGDPYDDNRAIVLSRDQLSQAFENLELVDDTGKTDLRDRLIIRLRDVCQKAAAKNEPVMLLATCHGDIEVSDGSFVIGLPEPVNIRETYPAEMLLSSEMLGNAIKDIPGLHLSTYTTSCFSEHWVITPNWRPLSHMVMGAALFKPETEEESHSWPRSTAGRYGGGVFSTHTLEELLIEAKVITAPEELGTIEGNLPDGRSFAQWSDTIKAHMARHQIRGFWYGSTPAFTAEGGHDKFWSRSGYPLGNYLANWEALPKISKSKHASPDFNRQRRLSDITVAETEEYEKFMASSDSWRSDAHQPATMTASWSGATGHRLISKVNDLARMYLASNPGLDTRSENRWIHTSCIEALEGRLKASEVLNLENALSYRLYKMFEAENVVRDLGISSLPPIRELNWEDWSSKHLEGGNNVDLNASFQAHLKKVMKWTLCIPVEGTNCGRTYLKPERYIAAELCLGQKDSDEEYERLAMKQRSRARHVAQRSLTSSDFIRRECDTARRTWRIEKKGSPRKQRASVQGVFQQQSGQAGEGSSRAKKSDHDPY
ncbi:hypothetical protein IFR04_009303 [Cadophora malorum]|uniref:Uncharacterized protein n=1 Tax=Cadophora malorum TaxID=108018 RepID=A0A8H7TEW1_9HELO|nr:hypothetical protein IFR04_009303 [Cadophora malorum]